MDEEIGEFEDDPVIEDEEIENNGREIDEDAEEVLQEQDEDELSEEYANDEGEEGELDSEVLVEDEEFLPENEQLFEELLPENEQLSEEEVFSENKEIHENEVNEEEESIKSIGESFNAEIAEEESYREESVEISIPEEDIKVKFCTVDDIERSYELILNSGLTVKQALEALSPFVNRTPDDMKAYVFYSRQEMSKSQTLNKYLKPGDETLICRVIFMYDDDASEPSVHEEYEPDVRVLKVLISKPDGTNKYLEVLIQNIAFTKEWCGGFRNKKTGVEYFNAWTQTNPLVRGRNLPPGELPLELSTRDTQTHLPYLETAINTPYDKSTQMWRSDFYVPSTNDVILVPKPYIPYNELKKVLTPLQAVLIIQRFFRYCLAKSKIKNAVILASEQNKAAANFQGLLNEEILADRMDLFVKQTFPLNRGDFYDLYTILGIWKQQAMQRIREMTDGVSRKAAMADLFEKEVECLYNIETQRIRSKNEKLLRRDFKVLQNSARYMVTRYRKGNLTITDTLSTQRAREFKEIFSSYLNVNTTKEQRIDVLTTFKMMLSKLDGIDVSQDIIHLLDREMDLVILDIPYKKMVGLRKRVETLFLNMMKNRDFNSQVLRLRDPSETKPKQPLYKCKGCGKLKTPAHFFSHLRLPSFHFCQSCSWMNTTANATINLAPYTRLLNMLRASETKKCCRSAVVFLLQPMGMYYLINVIWQGQSSLSGSSYLPELRMTRWDRNEEWAPWNTILLTEAEATIHDALDNLSHFYTRWFIQKVKQRQILARMHFSKVYYTDLELRESGKWTSVKDEGIYTNRRHSDNLDNDMINDFFKLPK